MLSRGWFFASSGSIDLREVRGSRNYTSSEPQLLTPFSHSAGEIAHACQSFCKALNSSLYRDGAAERTVGVPNGFDYELHNRKDIEKVLGDKAWAISFKDSACRCYGYMVSRPKNLNRTYATSFALMRCIAYTAWLASMQHHP